MLTLRCARAYARQHTAPSRAWSSNSVNRYGCISFAHKIECLHQNRTRGPISREIHPQKGGSCTAGGKCLAATGTSTDHFLPHSEEEELSTGETLVRYASSTRYFLSYQKRTGFGLGDISTRTVHDVPFCGHIPVKTLYNFYTDISMTQRGADVTRLPAKARLSPHTPQPLPHLARLRGQRAGGVAQHVVAEPLGTGCLDHAGDQTRRQLDHSGI